MSCRISGKLWRVGSRTLPPMDLKLNMARGMSAPAEARSAVRTLRATLDADVLADMTLLVSELVTNAVKYGEGRIRLRAHTRGTRHVLVEVLDEGAGFVPAAERRTRFSSGGVGLKLVDRIATSWGVEAAGTQVWFVIDRPAGLAAVA
jgi:anti-sigma regulatory factor (Ser/Thr protein kinase)